MRQITQCFNASLSSIYQEAAHLNTLTTLVKRTLGQEKAVPLTVSRFKNGCLLLEVQDAVWASELRYELPKLRDALRKEGLHHLTSIRIQLAPNSVPKTPKKKGAPVLSTGAKKILQSSAKGCSYEPLKAALERLSFR